jgi:LuxR family maltose regulon positive regulatory protein
VFDLAMAKLHCPLLRPGTVRRGLLLERLAGDASHPVVSVTAPAGYGKTTLLSQWAEANSQAFAWVSADEEDNDPRVLLTYIAEALDAIEPVDGRVFDALASSGSSVTGSVIPRLGAAFWSMTSPVVLVIDDVHVLHNEDCRAAVSVLADHVPEGSYLALAGRTSPPLPVARLRAEGKITEIGPADLSLTPAEADSLLDAVGLILGEDEIKELHQRTEGWPAGLYLAALYLKEDGPPRGTVASFGGDDRFINDYMESEFLARISPRQRMFLTRTAVLDRMCGPLCEAVLDLPGSRATLADLARLSLPLVPLDRRGQWYRYHHLFREMLAAELHRQEPGLMPVLRRRAAAWCLRNGLPEDALEYSFAAGDAGAAAGLVEKLWVPAYRQGRVATVQRWLRWLDERGATEQHPMATVLATLSAAVTGQSAEAERRADMADRRQDENPGQAADPAAAWATLVRAIMCRRGAEQMRADADRARSMFAEQEIVAPEPALYQGIARILGGDLDGGDESLEDAIAVAGEADAPETLAIALSEQALLAVARNQWDRAEALAGQAGAVLSRAEIEDLLACAVQAHAALHRGDIPAARRELVRAQRLRPLRTYALPHLAVQARIELVRVHLALADVAAARTLMREIDEILGHRPGLGSLVGEATALRAQLSRQRGGGSPGASALSAAELRVLPLLCTHLSSAEIAAELFVSLNTVKSQQASLYRKLGASSRSQAVARARQLGLLDGVTTLSFIPSGMTEPATDNSSLTGHRAGKRAAFADWRRAWCLSAPP